VEEWGRLTQGLVQNGVDLADPNAPLPERIGAFVLHDRLGQSKSGIVLDATTAQGIRVALKLARAPLEAAERKEETSRMLRELSVLKALHHPGIIRLADAGVVGGLLYMAVERVEGVTLRALIDGTAAEFDLVAAVGLQVGSTLAHLHTVGVLQREITPDVIIVRPDGRLLLADFGFSTFAGAPLITEPGPPRGTLGYVAPELFETGKATQSSDQYALGRLLFELCTPAQRSSIQANQATPAERQSAGWIDWASFPTGAYHRSLKPVLERMLSVEPGARFSDVYTAVAEIATLTAFKGLVDAGLVGRSRSSPQLRSTSGERAFAAFVDRVQHLQDDEKSDPIWRTISDSFSDVGAPFYASSYLLVHPGSIDRAELIANVCKKSERFFAERDASRVADQLRDEARVFWEDRAKKGGWTDEVTPLDPDPDASTAPGDGGNDTILDAEDSGARTLLTASFDSGETMPTPVESEPPKFLPVPRSPSAARDAIEEIEEQMHADTVSEALVIPRDPANDPAPVRTSTKLDLVQILVAIALLLVGLLIGFFLGRG
jgi:serine/threonine protein kinase